MSRKEINKATTISKAALTREINALKKYLTEVNHEISYQKPQPNGTIYLHGEVIARSFGSHLYRSNVVHVAMEELAYATTARAAMDM